jgi:hypothetical protein
MLNISVGVGSARGLSGLRRVDSGCPSSPSEMPLPEDTIVKVLAVYLKTRRNAVRHRVTHTAGNVFDGLENVVHNRDSSMFIISFSKASYGWISS